MTPNAPSEPREYDGWICSDGNYGKFAEDLCSSDPRLRRRDPMNESQHIHFPPTEPTGPQVILMQLKSNREVERAWPCTDGPSLRGHLAHPTATCSNNIYLLEGLSPDFVGVVGHHFGIHLAFFEDHQRAARSTYYAKDRSTNDTVLQPSLRPPDSYILVRYHETVHFDPTINGLDATVCCHVTIYCIL